MLCRKKERKKERNKEIETFMYKQTTHHANKHVTIWPVQQFLRRKIAIVYLSISLKMCCGCPKEPSH